MSYNIETLSKQFGSIDLLTAAIMRNNQLSYEVASDISNRLNSSDYIFDRLIEECVKEMEREGRLAEAGQPQFHRNYLLNVTFHAGSKDEECTDRDFYLLKTEKALSEKEIRKIFVKTDELLSCEPYEEEERILPISYKEGYNIDTLMKGIAIVTNGAVEKMLSSMGPLQRFDNYFVMENWQ